MISFRSDGGTPLCTDHLLAFKTIVLVLGVPLAEEKTEDPATRLTFLGILLDMVQ